MDPWAARLARDHPAGGIGAKRLIGQQGWRRMRLTISMRASCPPRPSDGSAFSVRVDGCRGILEPFDVPPEWVEARDVVDDEPGTVLALPWTRYMV